MRAGKRPCYMSLSHCFHPKQWQKKHLRVLLYVLIISTQFVPFKEPFQLSQCLEANLDKHQGRRKWKIVGNRPPIPVPEVAPILLRREGRIAIEMRVINPDIVSEEIPHLGEIKTGRAAERRYYWPAMWQQVVRECKDCDTCVRNQQSQASEPPPEEEDLASYPMEKMSADLCHFEGDPWLVLVAWYSNFTFAKN